MKVNGRLRTAGRGADIRNAGPESGAADMEGTMRRWSRFHAAALLAAAVPFLLFRSLVPLVLTGSASFGVLILVAWPAVKNLKPVFGWANMVTLARLTILLLWATFHRFFPGSPSACILIVLVLLDWLDGRLARKLNQRTGFGERFDYETDALYVCLAGCLLYISGRAPAWILLPAFLRYAFIAAVSLSGLGTVPERRTRFGPAVAVLMFLSLSSAFVLPYVPSLIVLACSSVLIAASFLYSFLLIAGAGRAASKSLS